MAVEPIELFVRHAIALCHLAYFSHDDRRLLGVGEGRQLLQKNAGFILNALRFSVGDYFRLLRLPVADFLLYLLRLLLRLHLLHPLQRVRLRVLVPERLEVCLRGGELVPHFLDRVEVIHLLLEHRVGAVSSGLVGLAILDRLLNISLHVLRAGVVALELAQRDFGGLAVDHDVDGVLVEVLRGLLFRLLLAFGLGFFFGLIVSRLIICRFFTLEDCVGDIVVAGVSLGGLIGSEAAIRRPRRSICRLWRRFAPSLRSLRRRTRG